MPKIFKMKHRDEEMFEQRNNSHFIMTLYTIHTF